MKKVELLPDRPDEGDVTLQTVADAADCAVSTVSRALRNDPAISDAVRLNIKSVAEQLNYRPLRNRRPKSKPRNSLASKQLAVLTLGMDRSLVSLPVVGATISGVEESISAAGAQLQIAHIPDPTSPPKWLADCKLDGVFLHGALHGTMLVDVAQSLFQRLKGVPKVWLLGRPEGCDGDSVVSADVGLGERAADYLAEHGHQHVAFVSPKPDHLVMKRRETGFVAQCCQRGLEVESYAKAPTGGWTLPIRPPLESHSVDHLIDALLMSAPRPTALFAATDSVAASCYAALARRSITVGNEISIISGNNDRPLISGLHPAITTFDIHAHEIGRLAVQRMEQILGGKTSPCSVEVQIEPMLVEGGSVANLTKPA